MVLLVASCGSTKNPDFCCLDEQDCAQFGETEFRSCPEGLACKANTCGPALCATDGCPSSQPVCVVATDTCTGCSNATDCSRFPAAPVCAPDGACVECVANDDCDVAKPVCDNLVCRTCLVDSDCASNACATDGSCVAEANAVYVATNGVDTGPCSKSAPCRTIPFALALLSSPNREHLVLAPGNYAAAFVVIDQLVSRVVVHGGGATLTSGSTDDPGILVLVPTTISDLAVVQPQLSGGIALRARAPTTLRRVKLTGFVSMEAPAQVMATDVEMNSLGTGVLSNASLVFDRVWIHGGQRGVVTTNSNIDFTNVLISGTTGVGLDLTSTQGIVKFSTVVQTGMSGGTPFGVKCASSGVVFQASIVWTTGLTTAPFGGSCTQFPNTIAGPMAVPGASNSDPMFIDDAFANDFHLKAGSPARDVLPSGPAVDVSGTARPAGSGFDLGAFEGP